jgi:hypothetical protein
MCEESQDGWFPATIALYKGMVFPRQDVLVENMAFPSK